MHITLPISLDPTLGCGQAHRWIKDGDSWKGVLRRYEVTLTQTLDGFNVSGCDDRALVEGYFRADDDLNAIIESISRRDPQVASLASRCPGLRILRQDRWECLATYMLATNVNVKRIAKMVENVCNTFGTRIRERSVFPAPKQILDKQELLPSCRLGFREKRFLEACARVESGDINLDEISKLDYRGCVNSLMSLDGVGPKVADCVALFAFDHLEAFPVDVRIAKCMERMYGVAGSYKAVSDYGMKRFGEYAGYAQEFLYHSNSIRRGQAPGFVLW